MALHSALTGSELHEPKGVASATVGTIYKANGSGSGSWTTVDYNTLGTNMLVQVRNSSLYTTATSITSVIPLDDTIPQSTEGTQIATVSITPKATTHALWIEGQFVGQWISANNAAWAIFQDSTASAIAAGGLARNDFANSAPVTTTFGHLMTAGTTSSTTFKLRVGPATGGTLYTNGGSSGRRYGGVTACWLKVTELKA